jgi:hypothetical protein
MHGGDDRGSVTAPAISLIAQQCDQAHAGRAHLVHEAAQIFAFVPGTDDSR